MAEYAYAQNQTVQAGKNVLLNNTECCGNPCVVHRDESGIVTLRGMVKGCQKRARFRVWFGANTAIPAGGAVAQITLAIAVSGEAAKNATMIVTPAAVENYFNVSAAIIVDVPAGCCVAIAVQNTGDAAIDVQNANMIVDRIA